MEERIAVMGLGYVGLPVALAFARRFPGTIGFDVNHEKIAELRRGYDRNQEISKAELEAASLTFTSDIADLTSATFLVVAVPTPVDEQKVPDLTPLVRAWVERAGARFSDHLITVVELQDVRGRASAIERKLVQAR